MALEISKHTHTSAQLIFHLVTGMEMVHGLCLITSQMMTYLLLLNTYVLCDAQITTMLIIVSVDA